MNRVIHFEIHASNPQAVAEFYRSVFGWEIRHWDNPDVEYWIVMTGPDIEQGTVAGEPGINGGIVKRIGPAPSSKRDNPIAAFVCTISVPSVDEYIRKIEAAGGKMVVPKMAIPGMAWLAYCVDIEGNRFGLFEPDKNAR